MFFLFSLISYTVYVNDPPIVLATVPGTEVSNINTLTEFYNQYSTSGQGIIIRTPPDHPIRKAQIREFNTDSCTDKIALNNTLVFRNTTELNALSAAHQDIVHNVATVQEACTLINQMDNIAFIIVGEGNPTQIGYHKANPFLPGVWNCFFACILVIAFIIWSMIHYANIDVQTRFSKKLY